jgi:hypothetical protein
VAPQENLARLATRISKLGHDCSGNITAQRAEKANPSRESQLSNVMIALKAQQSQMYQ